MTSLNYTVAVVGDEKVVAYAPAGGQPAPLLTATSFSHPGTIDEIVRRLGEGDETVVDLFSPEKAVKAKFEGTLTKDVKVADGTVFFRGEAVDNAVTEQILRFLDEGEDFKPLVRFMERLAANPQDHAREQSYRWLKTHNFTITEDGKILAYKGVQNDYKSITRGPAIVNGKLVEHADNTPGNVLEMARDEVVHDPRVACSVGLHAGTYAYAVDFARGRKVVEVLVDPADIVSVPTDASDAKMRVCQYVVVGDSNGQRTSALVKDVTKATPVAVLDDDSVDEFEGKGSLVHSAWWEDGELTVELHSGYEYVFEDEDKSLFTGLRDAPSQGKFFNERLKGRERY